VLENALSGGCNKIMGRGWYVLVILVAVVGIVDFHLVAPRCDDNKYPRQLTRHGKDLDASWSPNGKTIAFKSLRRTYDPRVAVNSRELWVVTAAGSEERPLISADDPDFGGYMEVKKFFWFPDSQSLLCLVHSKGYKRSLYRVFLDGTRATLLSITDGAEWLGDARLSPDGAKVAFTIGHAFPSRDWPTYRLYVAKADGSNKMRLAEGLIHGLTWTPDGASIIYSSYNREEKNYDLWEISVGGGEKRRICRTREDETQPSCSAN